MIHLPKEEESINKFCKNNGAKPYRSKRISELTSN